MHFCGNKKVFLLDNMRQFTKAGINTVLKRHRRFQEKMRGKIPSKARGKNCKYIYIYIYLICKYRGKARAFYTLLLYSYRSQG